MPHKESPEGYLSVTEVLNLLPKPWLCKWYGKYGTAKCEQIKRESQEIGTEIHRLIESLFKNHEVDNQNPRMSAMVGNFWNKFVMPFEVKPLELEVTLQNEKLKLQGTFDGYISTNKGEAIADWKTSNSLDKLSVPLQLSAYAYLHGFKCNQGVAVRIDKESDKVEVVWYDNLKQYWPHFRNLLKAAHSIKKLNEKA